MIQHNQPGVKTALNCIIHKIDKKNCEMLPFISHWDSGHTI